MGVRYRVRRARVQVTDDSSSQLRALWVAREGTRGLPRPARWLQNSQLGGRPALCDRVAGQVAEPG
jgi:hypothetical protein